VCVAGHRSEMLKRVGDIPVLPLFGTKYSDTRTRVRFFTCEQRCPIDSLAFVVWYRNGCIFPHVSGVFGWLGDHGPGNTVLPFACVLKVAPSAGVGLAHAFR